MILRIAGAKKRTYRGVVSVELDKCQKEQRLQQPEDSISDIWWPDLFMFPRAVTLNFPEECDAYVLD